MTANEAIKGLKTLAKEFSGYKPNEEMFDMAIEALEKQTPMKAKLDDENCICYCPVCDSEVDWKRFCEECGQAIDYWSEL